MGIDALSRELHRAVDSFRRRRYYSLTRTWRKTLVSQRSLSEGFIDALNRVAHIRHA
jgi:hypothetical protein